ncbi:MAG TPA: tetratricopeptide repeat protein [Longimicrobiaceae bacterium]|nr:tetratricopeptide repeat protein [Longimicrobiaceae bacterium]
MADSPSALAAEIRKLEQKHEEDPEGRYFVPLANAYRQLGELEHAEVLLTDGLKRHPEYLSAHIVLGRCYLDRGALPAAEEEFRRVLAIDAQNLIALRTLGEVATEQGRLAEAERWYAELLDADPLNEEARRALAGLAHTGEASADEGQGEDGEVVTETIAELYARQGFYDRAAAVYRELLRRRGHSPELARRLREIESSASGAARAPRAQPEPPAAAEPSATIADYLAALLAWTPATVAPSSVPVEATTDGLASWDGEHEYAAPSPGEEVSHEAHLSSAWAAKNGSRDGDPEIDSFQTWLRSLSR